MFKTVERHRITGTEEYFRDRSRAFALIVELEKQNELTLFRCIQEARSDETVQEILRAQRRKDFLEPNIEREDYDENACGYSEMLMYWTAEGVVREEIKSVSHEEGSSFRRRTYLNGLLHDLDGEPAVVVRNFHYIPEEKHLDEDYRESWRHGEMISKATDYDSLRGRLTDQEAEYYGWHVDYNAA